MSAEYDVRMKEPSASLVTWIVVGGLLAGCSSSVASKTTGSDSSTTTASTSGGSGSGAGATTTSLGGACIPQEESDPTFQGFSVADVSVGTKAASCASSVCLVNHFQGRVTCPYGQVSPGVGPVGPSGSPAANVDSQDGCVLPGAKAGAPGSQVTATDVNVAGYPTGEVPPQLTGTGAADRTASHAVYCSCRCANVEGNTNDGADYCACPENYTCTQLVTSIGATEPAITGAYCVENGTAYNPALSTSETCLASVDVPEMPGYCPAQK